MRNETAEHRRLLGASCVTLLLLASAALAIQGCGRGPKIRFMGSAAAAGAEVFVDGESIGRFGQVPPDRKVAQGLVVEFAATIRLQPQHAVMVITSTRDTLWGLVKPNDSGAVFIRPEERRIDYL